MSSRHIIHNAGHYLMIYGGDSTPPSAMSTSPAPASALGKELLDLWMEQWAVSL